MKLRSIVTAALLVGSSLGIASTATPAFADCESEIVVFFSPGTTAAGTQVTARSANGAAVGCTASDASGATIDLFYIAPGMAFAKARHTGASGDIAGSIHGMGASFNGQWTRTEHTVPGTFYVESPFVAMDPTTTSGSITASGLSSTQTYRTLDR